MTSSRSTPPRSLRNQLAVELKSDRRRAIDRYIDYFGDGAATGTEPLARRVTSVDEQAILDSGAEGPGRHLPRYPGRRGLASSSSELYTL
jgi:hypothetical protein